MQSEVNLTPLAQCGGLIEDLDGDGRNDMIYCDASLPFHVNGANSEDLNNASTIFTEVFQNVAP